MQLKKLNLQAIFFAQIMHLAEIEGFNLGEFLERWKRARVSALNTALGVTYSFDQSETEILSALRDALTSEKKDQLLRLVFDVSRKFSLSAVRYFGVQFEVEDFSLILSQSGMGCFSLSVVEPHSYGSQVLRRTGCEGVKTAGSFLCDYWREAADGLVMGAGSQERLARHASVGHGDSECVDVLYLESPKGEVRFGIVPSEILEKLKDVQDSFEKQQVRLTFEGLSEGILYFKMEHQGKAVCGAGGRLFQDALVKEIRSRFPGMGLQDVSPLAVYGEKA